MFKKIISIMLTLLLVLVVTSCSTFIMKTPVVETKNPEKKIDNVSEENQGVIVDGELRFYNGELVDVSKQLIKNSLTALEICGFFEFPVDIDNTIADNNGIVYSEVIENKYGINSLKDMEKLFASIYSNEDTIRKMSYRNSEPLFIERNGKLYASSDGSSGTVGYSVQDWYSIYLTDITETTAVVNYPLFYYWSGIEDAAVMHKNTITKVNGTWLIDGLLNEDPIKLDEKTSEELGIRSIFLNNLYSFNMYDFIEHEGERLEVDGSKYINIGYIISPGDPFASLTYNNLDVYIKHANDETLEIINDYFIEIDEKLYVKNIEKLKKEYTRDYKYETLEVLSVNNEEASLKINYLDIDNNEKTLNFKMFSDPERSWIWYLDTIL